MKISVIIPSRLQENLNGDLDGIRTLWLDRALMSAVRQNTDIEREYIVGLSPGHPRIPERFEGVKFIVASKSGQAAAVNAAVEASTGDVLAFLEDDDYWRSLNKLEIQLPNFQWNDVITSNQREITWDGQFVRINDFPTPSGWLMKRAVWEEVGGLDESYRFHVDTEWLGRLNKSGFLRTHMVEKGVLSTAQRPWLEYVSRQSLIITHDELEPLVERTVNPEGGMATIASDPAASSQSADEHRRMMEAFGEVPW